MITKEQAQELLFTHLKNDKLRKHCLATALIMDKLALKFGFDPDEWYITGLLHDIDLEYIGDDFQKHGIKAQELLVDIDISDEMRNAIVSHSGNRPLNTTIDKALWIADPVNGLIIASALMRPDNKISSINLKSLKKKFKNKAFAAGASREQIACCVNLGIELDEYLELSLNALAENEKFLGFDN